MTVALLAFVGQHLLLLLALAAVATALGLPVTAWVRRGAARPLPTAPPTADGTRRLAMLAEAAACGLGILAMLALLLGFAERLAAGPLLVVVGLAPAAAAAALWRQRGQLAAPPPAPPTAPSRRLGRRAIGGAVLLAPFALLALYPPTAFDETLYHLPIARAFAASGGLPFLPELRFPVGPQLAEVLAAVLLLLAGEVATHLLQLLAVLLTALVLWVWGTEWAEGTAVKDASAGQGDGTSTPALVGWLAAAAWLGNPIVAYLGGTGYVEPLLALFLTTACWTTWRWTPAAGRRGLVVAGALAGAAAATKYLGLFAVGALPLLIAFAPSSWSLAAGSGRRSAAARALDAAAFLAGAALLVVPWYGRIVALTGNPLFPYLSGWFGDNAWLPVRFHELPLRELVAGFARLLTLPWDVLANRARVGQMPPFSPAVLLLAPALLWAALRAPRLRAPALLAAGFVALFPVLPPDARYLVTVLPLACLPLAAAAARLLPGTGRTRRAVGLLLAVHLVLPAWLYGLYRLYLQGAPPTTPAARTAYLARALPLYPAVASLRAVRPPGAVVYGLYAEGMRDHVGEPFKGDWYGPDRYARLVPRLGDPAALHAELRAMGVDYLLAAQPPPSAPVPPPPALAERDGFRLLFADAQTHLYALLPAVSRLVPPQRGP